MFIPYPFNIYVWETAVRDSSEIVNGKPYYTISSYFLIVRRAASSAKHRQVESEATTMLI